MTRLVLALLAGLAIAVPAHAFVLGRYVFHDPAAAPGATTPLVLEREGAHLTARRAEGDAAGIAWQLGVDAAGPRVGMSPAALPPCARLHLAVQPRDVDGDGVLDAARGEALRLFAASSLEASAVPGVIAALDADAHTLRLRWRLDGAALPAPWRLLAPPTPARIYDALAHRARDVLVLGAGWPRDPAGDPRRAGGTLLVIDADTGTLLAAPVPGFESALGGGITAVDLDADGLGDRLYLADAAGRLWRIELPRPGAAPGRWPVQLVADLLSALPPDQAFVHAPDVVRLDRPPLPPGLAISVASSDLDAPSASPHWLFQLRDPLSAGSVMAVTASDLALDGPEPGSAAGFRRRLPGPLAAPLLTVDGRLLVVTRRDAAASCRVGVEPDALVTVTALDRTGPSAPTGLAVTAITLPAAPGAMLLADWTDARGEGLVHLECRIGDTPLALCPAVPRLRREWWLRGDAP